MVVSLLVLFHLAALVISPLTLPLRQGQEIAAETYIPAIPSESLLGSLRKVAGTYGKAVYLNHGYQFFAPDPGPSHLIQYEVVTDDGSTIKGQFPDRSVYWPRLRYHRWFMLSETLAQEFDASGNRMYQVQNNELLETMQELRRSGQGDEASLLINEFEQIKPANLHRRQQENLNALIVELMQKGARGEAKKLQAVHDRLDKAFKASQESYRMLTNSVAQYLMRKHRGKQIKLWVVQRDIPFRTDVLRGLPLDDPRYLGPDPPFELISLEDLE